MATLEQQSRVIVGGPGSSRAYPWHLHMLEFRPTTNACKFDGLMLDHNFLTSLLCWFLILILDLRLSCSSCNLFPIYLTIVNSRNEILN